MTKAKILIVRDHDSAAGLEGCLEDLGYTVCATVSSAPRAVETAAETRPDLALIDLELDTGVEAAEEIGGRFGLPVIYLTGDVDEALSPRAKATHPFGYVLKPVEERQLHLNIQAALAMQERNGRHRETESRLERSNRELSDRTRLMQLVLDSVRDGVIACDEDGEYLVFNTSAERMVGSKMQEFDLHHRSEGYGLYLPDGTTLFPSAELPLARAIRGESSDEVEVLVRNPQAPEGICLSVSGRPLVHGDDAKRGGVIVFRDVTREKEARTELEQTLSELQSQSQLLQTVFETMNEAVVLCDSTGRLLLANPRMEEILGVGMESSSPHGWSRMYDAFYPDGERMIPTDELPLVRALRGEVTQDMEVFVRNERKPEGVHVSATARPIFGDGGKVVKAGVVVFSDTTRHKEAEAKLSRTVARLRNQTQLMKTIFDSMKDAVIATDEKGKYLFSNSAAYEMGGKYLPSRRMDAWSRDYGIYRADGKTLLPTKENPLVRAIRGEKMDGVELFLRNEAQPDGIHISVTTRPMPTREGAFGGGVMVVRDIDEHKKAQAELAKTMEELRDQSELMETTFDSISDGIVVADARGNFLYVNPAAEQIVGMGSTDASPEEWAESYGTFYPDRETPVEAKDLPLLRAIFGGESTDEMDLFVRNDNRPEGVFIRVSGRPLLNEVGGIRGGVIAFRDVTEHMLSEEALGRAFAQGRLDMIDTILHNIGNAINSVTVGIRTLHQDLANDRVLRRFRALSDAVNEHRHDWIEYLGNDPQGQKVIPFITALAEDFAAMNEGLMRTTERVRDRAEHIADIVRTQKALGNSSMDRKDLDLEEAMTSAIRVLQDSLNKRGTRIDCDCEEAPEVIRIQESQFHQMMVNLLKNAIEAVDELAASGGLEETPHIRIRAGVEGDFLRIDVSDNGIGIDMDQNSSRIFAAGFSTKENGSGLGLHSVANFVIGSGGQIRPFSDGIGKGATMRAMLRLSSVIPPAPQGTERSSR